MGNASKAQAGQRIQKTQELERKKDELSTDLSQRTQLENQHVQTQVIQNNSAVAQQEQVDCEQPACKDTLQKKDDLAVQDIAQPNQIKKGPELVGQDEKKEQSEKTSNISQNDQINYLDSSHSAVTTKKKHYFTFYVMVFTGMFTAACIGIIAALFISSNNRFFSSVDDVELPIFTHKTKEEVLENRVYRKFRFEIQEVFSETEEAGVIVDQIPKPPKSVKENAVITLKVSKGIEKVSVPNVVGWNKETAREKFKDIGLSVLIKSQPDDSVAPNKVIATEPKAGSIVSGGSTVTVVISTPTASRGVSVVPNVIGLSQSSAISKLSQYGFEVSTATRRSERPAGTVVSQSPKKGQKRGVGSSIVIYISDGKGQAQLPQGGAVAGQALYPGGPMVGYGEGQVVPGSVTGHIHEWTPLDDNGNQICYVCGERRHVN